MHSKDKLSTEDIIRQLTICIIIGESHPIIKWFDGLFDDTMYASHLDDMHTIYFKFRTVRVLEQNLLYKNLYLNGKWMFYYDKINNTFECNYEYFWKVLGDKLMIYYNYEEGANMYKMRSVTKLLLDRRFNTYIPLPRFRCSPVAAPHI